MTRRIVVADDEADIRRLIAFTLRRRGFEVAEVGAGDMALNLIRARLPDLVVLDMMMPGLTGQEVACALRADPTTAMIPIIMLSAKGQLAEVRQGIAAGANAYLVKPFSPSGLAAKVEELLGPTVADPALPTSSGHRGSHG
ncbi:MAG: response regulator [Chloroflexota bacterium]|nr:response regulator [Chloroflexota bacterium]